MTTDKRAELEKWWWATNGTGTAACSECREIICTWHSARLDDLANLFDQYTITVAEETKPEKWWITTAPISQLHQKILGPFGSQELALKVRGYLEKLFANKTYWVDVEPLTKSKEVKR